MNQHKVDIQTQSSFQHVRKYTMGDSYLHFLPSQHILPGERDVIKGLVRYAQRFQRPQGWGENNSFGAQEHRRTNPLKLEYNFSRIFFSPS